MIAMHWFSYGGNSIGPGRRSSIHRFTASDNKLIVASVPETQGELALEKCGGVERHSNYEVCRGTSGCQ